jgi:hypothetical protein
MGRRQGGPSRTGVRGRIPHHFSLLRIWFSPAGIKMVRDGRFVRALKNSQLTCGETKGI